MRNTITDMNQYLDAVRRELHDFPDRESIINELHQHIWDLANDISRDTGKPVDQAFTEAMMQLEDPVTLAENFREENEPAPSFYIPGIQEKLGDRPVVPERKLTSEQTAYIAMGGIFAVSFILIIISAFTDESVFSNIWFTILQFVLVVGVIAGVLYYRDEQEFKDQLQKLRKKFEFKELVIEENKLKVKERPADQKSTMWPAIGAHLEGFLGLIFTGLWLIILFVLTFFYDNTFLADTFQFYDSTPITGFFNDNWYYTGFIASIVIAFVGLGLNFILMIAGQIREIRLYKAFSSLVESICNIVLVLFYPLRIGYMLEKVPELADATFIANVDEYMRIFLIFLAGIQLMMVMYHGFKYATWLPKDKKSLLVNN